MTRRTQRTGVRQMRRLREDRVASVALSHEIGARRRSLTWFKLQHLTVARVNQPLSVGTYAGAKQAAQETAAAWMDRELHRPSSSLNHRTLRICGKPYHWRQDYTGQLKLTAGESPW